MSICDNFPVTEEEYGQLDKKFGDLIHYIAWQLLKNNAKNNHTDEIEDIAQELRCSIYRAGCYYKRQIYIESCFKAIRAHIVREEILVVVDQLEDLWKNRTRHGAGKVKFGEPEEILLDGIVTNHLIEEHRPDKTKTLDVNGKFGVYAKSIIWNQSKQLGKKITREKGIRSGITSLSMFDYLGIAI